MDAMKAVDDYLVAKHGIGLEAALCDGCVLGRTDAALAASVKIVARLEQAILEEDGGEARVYAGVFILDQLWYRFRCQVFIDAGGLTFLADVSEFEGIEWRVRLAMSA